MNPADDFPGSTMSTLPREIEAAVRALEPAAACLLHNRLIKDARPMLGVSDSAYVAQILGRKGINPIQIMKSIALIKT
jgi:hypothetical protein